MANNGLNVRFTWSATDQGRFTYSGSNLDEGLRWDATQKRYWPRGARHPLSVVMDAELKRACQRAVGEWARAEIQEATRQLPVAGTKWQWKVTHTLQYCRIYCNCIEHGALESEDKIERTEEEMARANRYITAHLWADRSYLDDLRQRWGARLSEEATRRPFLDAVGEIPLPEIYRVSIWHQIAQQCMQLDGVKSTALVRVLEKELQIKREASRMEVTTRTRGSIPKESSPRSDEHNPKSSARKI